MVLFFFNLFYSSIVVYNVVLISAIESQSDSIVHIYTRRGF